MKLIRYKKDSQISYGILDGNRVREIQGDIFGDLSETGTQYPLEDVMLLAPCVPTKMFALAGNYKSHLGGGDPSEEPQPFFKVPTSVLDPMGTIIIPRGSGEVHYEGEMVAVIKKTAKRVSPEEAPAYILGVTCGNDVSARIWQRNDRQWWRAKSSDTFSPMGPVIDTEADYGNLLLQTRLNGEVVQSQSTADLIFDAPHLVSFISQVVTLLPGDAIFTGTPGTTGRIKAGDIVEVELEGVGILKNSVADEEL
ncbi:TPA: FAA hydrolase family protein [Candidatus Poribacteria bacterium]|nr:FAA hydrolase family protein [Candidatus Poribacteria bacterium]